MSDDQSSHDNKRGDFIKEMYRVYWANMSRSMEGIWKVLAPITVGGTILAGVHKDYLPASVGISLADLVVFWALNITIDLNAWHRRNLFFVVKAEQEFLIKSDYGRLLPAKYSQPSTGWITFYLINLLAFIAFLGVSTLYALLWMRPSTMCWEWLLPVGVVALGSALTAYNAYIQERSARSHFDELFQDRKG
jgi:hypothetical protein